MMYWAKTKHDDWEGVFFRDRLLRHLEDRGVRIFGSLDHSKQWWFLAQDVCRLLGIRNSRATLARLDEDDKDTLTVGTPGSTRALTIMSEDGVRRLVRTGRTSEARWVRWWVKD